MDTKTKKTAQPDFFKRSVCPITNTLEIIGDKWTMIIIRDLFLGLKTYSEFQQSPENIPSNILADRLKKLEAGGIIDKIPYQDRPVRYEYHLSKQGKGLSKILKAMKHWGLEFIPGTSAKMAEQLLKKGKKIR